MIGRVIILIVASIVLVGGFPRAGVALPVAPLNKVQTGEFNNLIEVAAGKNANRKATVTRKTTVNRGNGQVNRRTTVTKRANGNVNRNVYVNRNVNRNKYYNNRRTVVVHRPYRSWARRPYYGTVLGGVALGTVIGVGAAYAVPAAPAPNMCWYWADRGGWRGYWDYCVAP